MRPAAWGRPGIIPGVALAAAITVGACAILAGCGGRGEREKQAKRPPAVTPPAATSPAPPAPPPPPPPPARNPVRYAKRPIDGQASLNALHREFGDRGMAFIFEINRRDLAHFRSGDTLVVPESVPVEDSGFLDYAPFPLALPGAAGGVADAGAGAESLGTAGAEGVASAVPKLVLVSIAVQAFGVYEDDRLVRWGAVSTGRRDAPTPPGLYHVNWKARQHVSTVDAEWELPWVLNLDNEGGISMHEYALPGYPASHSCIRLLGVDAEWLYGWVDQWTLTPDQRAVARPGTPILVFGEWAWGRRAPWRRLPADSAATTLSEEALRAALAQYLGGPAPAAPATSPADNSPPAIAPPAVGVPPDTAAPVGDTR